MFEPDDEQKAVVIDKKEQQKMEDDFEKSDKSIDQFLSKQLPMLIAPDYIKEIGLDKATTQAKTEAYFRALDESQKRHMYNEMMKQLQLRK